MSKGETSAGFMSKVARFVKNPTTHWADLDRGASTSATPTDRQALKAAIERKRRNDQIRRKEFDYLRDILYRKRAQQDNGVPDSVQDTSYSKPQGIDATKARTIEQIARIEAQMSRHWLDRSDAVAASANQQIAGKTIPGRPNAPIPGSVHLQSPTVRDTVPLPIDMLSDDHHGVRNGPVTDPLLALADTAVRFANGEDNEVEGTLRALLAQEVHTPAARFTWQTLLDLFHARGDLERFEDAAAEYAELYATSVPRWPVGQVAASPVALPGDDGPRSASGRTVWRCPMLLDGAAVEGLRQAVEDGTGVKWLDWTGLVTADLAAAEALMYHAQVWAEQALSFRFVGASVLRRRLKASTPSGRRENDKIWWQLRLALLRLMHRVDEFDLVALDYCVTYGVLPPKWLVPECRFELADSPPVDLELDATAGAPTQPMPLNQGPGSTQPAGLEWPVLPGDTLPMGPEGLASASAPGGSGPAVLSGVLKGDIADVIARLQAALDRHPAGQVFSVDCQQLRRMDFVAAGSLMQWLLVAMGRGVRPELQNVNRLVAAFFHVVGIDEAVTVRLRQY